MACSVNPRRATAAEKAMEKHMGGCMAGFLHLFDGNHLLSSKRLHHSPSTPPATPPPAAPSRVKVEEGRIPVTRPLPLPALDEGLLRSSWKLRDYPRLSLDSRVGANLRCAAPVELARHSEAAEKLGRRGPGVVARLMGLDPMPPAPEKKTELRRSASESRVSCRRLLDLAPPEKLPARPETATEKRKEPTLRCQQQRRSFFDVFPPEPAKKTIAGIPAELEKKLKLRWVDDRSTDLEALKQILEALQLKGLLHTATTSPAPEKKRNLVYDGRTPPARSPRTPPARRPPAGDFSPPSSPHKCRRPATSPNRKPSPATSTPHRRKSPARLPPPAGDEDSSTTTTMSTMSDSNGSGQSYSDAGERGLMAECYYKEGRSLLERCDKLLQSIAEIAGNEQPSPVSVLDATTFYREEEEDEDGSPPPIPMKRCLLFHGSYKLI